MSQTAIFTAIVPKKTLDSRKLKRELASALDEEGRKAKRELEKTTSTWEHSVKFMVRTILSGNEMKIQVSTNDDIWNYLNTGTGLYGPKKRKYPITSKTPLGKLRFQTSYNPKTKVGIFGSTCVGPSGSFVYASSVMHPGIKARRWTESLSKKRRPLLRARLQVSMARAWVRAIFR